MAGPLNGVRILDLTTMVSGPMATMMLADQGADVIKIESPRGDHMRHVSAMNKGMSASFLSCNRSKRGLALDIKKPEGLAIVKDLVATADVLVQNFRPGAIERMGLGEDVVREIRPDIVFVSISGFGETGPYAGQRVYDPVIQALCGLADIQTDYATGQPRMVRTIIPDKTTAVAAAQAITAALFARDADRRGAACPSRHARHHGGLSLAGGHFQPDLRRQGNRSGSGPDGARSRLQDRRRLHHGRRRVGFGMEGHVPGARPRGSARGCERFATAGARAQKRPERREIVGAEMEKWQTAEILARLDREDVPAAPVLTRWQLLDDAQIEANGTIEIHEDDLLGKVRQPRPAARFDRTPAAVRMLAPFLGADNAAILQEIGYSGADIERLAQGGDSG